MKSYHVNGYDITIKDSIFTGTLSLEEYEGQILTALSKIGVRDRFIQIKKIEKGVQVEWKINDNSFSFICQSQEDLRLNMGAIAQAIQEDVRQIMRGIKDLDLVMKQYQLDSSTIELKKPKSLHEFKEEVEEEWEEEYDTNFYSPADARRVISEIKKRYSSFTDLALIPEKDRDVLRKAYLYLGVAVKF